jgi:hypothetical protein
MDHHALQKCATEGPWQCVHLADAQLVSLASFLQSLTAKNVSQIESAPDEMVAGAVVYQEGTPMRGLSCCKWCRYGRWTTSEWIVSTSSSAVGGSTNPKAGQAQGPRASCLDMI